MGIGQKEDNKEIDIEQIIDGLKSLKESLIKEINNEFEAFQIQFNSRNNSRLFSLINESKQIMCNQLYERFEKLQNNLRPYKESKNMKTKNSQQQIRGNNFNIRENYIKKNNIKINNNQQKIESNIKNISNDKSYGNFQFPNYINELDIITPKDIQTENKLITNKLRKKALKQVDDNDNISNKTFAFFLKDVANVSRQAFNQSKELFNSMFEDFQKNVIRKKQIQSNYNKQYFSSWIKYREKNQELYGNLKYIKLDICNKKEEIINYMKELFFKLTILYFHCQLSFPPVEIDFNAKNNQFDYESMIDILNNGKGEIHFVYLPSLYSNENYLENSKLWVYMKNENSYSFNKIILDQLNKVITNQ